MPKGDQYKSSYVWMALIETTQFFVLQLLFSKYDIIWKQCDIFTKAESSYYHGKITQLIPPTTRHATLQFKLE